MNIQIFGKKKCFDTGKAERFFKERKVKYQLIDLPKYGMSKGELDSVARCVGLRNVIDEESKLYKDKQLDKIRGEDMVKEIVLANPSLIKTPVVRNGKIATVGFQQEVWKEWLLNE